ncbi:MAG: RnfH family protein, partial [Gammaproteobacteria bacterium]|nr:RnfH family protein [Gammaproteobacteria bacterium]
WRRQLPPLGVRGRQVAPEHLLTEGDRLEIYRPLMVDAKTARRRRAVG